MKVWNFVYVQKSINYKLARGIFMYKDEQLERAERYERKLQLVQAIRVENQANAQRMHHRNNIFYATGGETLQKESYDKSLNGVPNKEAYKSSSLLGLRICISVLLVFAYMGLKTGKIPTVSGINAKEIKAYVTRDFSKVVVDYMKNITYTLNYEKTSIK